MVSAPVANFLLFLVVTAGVFVVIALVYSMSKFEQLSVAARSSSDQAFSPHEAFLLHMADRMSLWRSGDASFSIVLADALPRDGGMPLSAEALAAILGRNVRKGVDEFRVLDEAKVGLILGCTPDRLGLIHCRWERVSGLRMRVGTAHYPGSGATARELMEVAERAWKEASLGGTAGPGSNAGEQAEDDSYPVDERFVDPLTGVLRRERLVPAALKYMARWRREGQVVSLLLFGFDALDSINQRFGRTSGDDALRTMGRLLESSLRETDLIGRLEGDELVALLPASAENALRIGRRLLDAYAKAASMPGPVHVRGTVSVGVAAAPEDAREFPELLQCARKALAHGRRAGRARCTRFKPDVHHRKSVSSRAAPPYDRF